MLIHSVYFWFKPDVDAALMTRFEEGLARLTAIPEILRDRFQGLPFVSMPSKGLLSPAGTRPSSLPAAGMGLETWRQAANASGGRHYRGVGELDGRCGRMASSGLGASPTPRPAARASVRQDRARALIVGTRRV